MSENSKCPKCGTPMVPSKLDNSFNLDGTTNLSGLKCPKCSAESEQKEENN